MFWFRGIYDPISCTRSVVSFFPRERIGDGAYLVPLTSLSAIPFRNLSLLIPPFPPHPSRTRRRLPVASVVLHRPRYPADARPFVTVCGQAPKCIVHGACLDILGVSNRWLVCIDNSALLLARSPRNFHVPFVTKQETFVIPSGGGRKGVPGELVSAVG